MLEEINKGPPDPIPALQPDLNYGDTPSDPSECYYLPKVVTVRDLTGWLAENQGDPALHVSVRPSNYCWLTQMLRARLSNLPYIDHLYLHIKGQSYNGGEHSFSSQEHYSIIIIDN
jgi:hypothetical protein